MKLKNKGLNLHKSTTSIYNPVQLQNQLQFSGKLATS